MDLSAHKEAEVSLLVIRCGCGDPDSHMGAPCPAPRKTTDLGVVSFTSSNKRKQLFWDLFGKRKADERIEAEARS